MSYSAFAAELFHSGTDAGISRHATAYGNMSDRVEVYCLREFGEQYVYNGML